MAQLNKDNILKLTQPQIVLLFASFHHSPMLQHQHQWQNNTKWLSSWENSLDKAISMICPRVSRLCQVWNSACWTAVSASLVCERRRRYHASVTLPALTLGADPCRRILNQRQCAMSLTTWSSAKPAHPSTTDAITVSYQWPSECSKLLVGAVQC